MSEQTEVNTALVPSSTVKPGSPSDGVRQLPYAWAGLWSIAVEELGNFYQRCVARGEQVLKAPPAAERAAAEPQAPEAVASRRAAAPRRIRPMTIVNAFGAVESYHFDLNVDQLLPTKEELDAIAERVEVLAREVDALVEQRKAELPGSQE